MTTVVADVTTEQQRGHECVRVPGGDGLVALAAVDVGPRILFLGEPGGENLLAELPDRTIDGPAGPYRLLGGHRLWTAPEVPSRTYLPDGERCRVEAAGDRVTITAPDDGSGLERGIGLRPVSDGLEVAHLVTNVGSAPAEVASWAITQFPMGGTAFLPLPGSGSSAYEASHALVLWPYSQLDDPRLSFGPDHVVVTATDSASALKVGSAPGSGRLGSLRDGLLSTKEAPVPDGSLPDRGAASQVYVESEFLELETLGLLERLSPGESTGHTETWRVAEVDGPDEALAQVLA